MMRNTLFKLGLYFLAFFGAFKDIAPDAYSNSSIIATWRDFASATLDNLGDFNFLSATLTGSDATDAGVNGENAAFHTINSEIQIIIGGQAIGAWNSYWAPNNYPGVFSNPLEKNAVLVAALVAFLNQTYGFHADSNVPTSGTPLADLLKVLLTPFANMSKCQALWMQPYVNRFIELQSAALDIVVPEPQNDYQSLFLNTCRNAFMNDVASINPVTLQGGTVQVPPTGITINPSGNLNLGNAVTYYSNTQNNKYLTQFFPGSIATALATAFPVNSYVGKVVGDSSGASTWQFPSSWYYLSDASNLFGARFDVFCAKSLALFAAYQNSSSGVKAVLYPFMKNILFGLNQSLADQTVTLFPQLDALVIATAFTLNNYGSAQSDANTPALYQKLMSFHNEAHSLVFAVQDFSNDVARYKWVNNHSFEGYYTPQGGSATSTPIPLMLQNVQAFQTVFNNFYNYSSLSEYQSAIKSVIAFLASGLASSGPALPQNAREVLLAIKLFYENVLLVHSEMMWSFMQNQEDALSTLAMSLANVTNPLASGTISSALTAYKQFVEGYFNSFFVGVNNKLAAFEARLITLLEADPTLWHYIASQFNDQSLSTLIRTVFFGGSLGDISAFPSAMELAGTQNYYMDNNNLSYYAQGVFYVGQNYDGDNIFYIGQDAAHFGGSVTLTQILALTGVQGQLLGTNQLAAPIASVIGTGSPNPVDLIKSAQYARTAWYKDLVCLLDTPKSVANVSNNLNLFGRFVAGYGTCDCLLSSNYTFSQVFPA